MAFSKPIEPSVFGNLFENRRERRLVFDGVAAIQNQERSSAESAQKHRYRFVPRQTFYTPTEVRVVT